VGFTHPTPNPEFQRLNLQSRVPLRHNNFANHPNPAHFGGARIELMTLSDVADPA
jgi:hypothetical protein